MSVESVVSVMSVESVVLVMSVESVVSVVSVESVVSFQPLRLWPVTCPTIVTRGPGKETTLLCIPPPLSSLDSGG